MFTIEQIKAAHSKVKSGADFPQYIQDMKGLGVTHYDHFVKDGSSDYYGADGSKASKAGIYPEHIIAPIGSSEKLQQALTIHQKGQTDYFAFCTQSAEAGVEKWTVDMRNMTCVYYDLRGNTMITETIPQP